MPSAKRASGAAAQRVRRDRSVHPTAPMKTRAPKNEEPELTKQPTNGRHGGNHGREKGDNQNPTWRDSRNSDLDSLAENRNVDRGGGDTAKVGR